eukprot:1639037-Prymnesium_polylepis.1
MRRAPWRARRLESARRATGGCQAWARACRRRRRRPRRATAAGRWREGGRSRRRRRRRSRCGRGMAGTAP